MAASSSVNGIYTRDNNRAYTYTNANGLVHLDRSDWRFSTIVANNWVYKNVLGNGSNIVPKSDWITDFNGNGTSLPRITYING